MCYVYCPGVSEKSTLNLHLISQEKYLNVLFIFITHKLEKHALADPIEIRTRWCFSSLSYYGSFFFRTSTLHCKALIIQLINNIFLNRVPSTIQANRDTLINKIEQVHDLTELTLEGQTGAEGALEWEERQATYA